MDGTNFPKIAWPEGKQFAFTIFDDPDFDTAENVATMYSFLRDIGLSTTKAVWPLKGSGTPRVGGVTCEDQQYLKLILSLQRQGFEIAIHNVTYHTSIRHETVRGLEIFERLFGHPPSSMANHSGCDESIYWGSARVTGLQRFIYNLLNLRMSGRNNLSQGHLENGALFWGDLCREKVKYVRNFVFCDINTLKACPMMPYHDPARPFVNYWFAASEGANIHSFTSLTSESHQERLVKEGGASIIYTHFAKGFLDRGRINGRFKMLMERLSKMNGWFVPVSTLLDFMLQAKGRHVITRAERCRLERRWIWHKIVHTRGRT